MIKEQKGNCLTLGSQHNKLSQEEVYEVWEKKKKKVTGRIWV